MEQFIYVSGDCRSGDSRSGPENQGGLRSGDLHRVDSRSGALMHAIASTLIR